MRSRLAVVSTVFALGVATQGCATKALYEEISKTPRETVRAKLRKPVALTKGIRTPAGVYVIQARYSHGQTLTVSYDPAAPGAKKAWPRAVPEQNGRLPIVRSGGDINTGGSTPLCLEPCPKGKVNFPCAQLRGNTLLICQGPGKPIPVARLRVWAPVRERDRELTGQEVVRKIFLGALFPFAATADVAIGAGIVALVGAAIWACAGFPGLAYAIDDDD